MPNGYGGGACAWANHLRNVYRHDEETGHPAAAADLLNQLHRAERSCGGVPYGFNEYRWSRLESGGDRKDHRSPRRLGTGRECFGGGGCVAKRRETYQEGGDEK